jgi:adenylate cyclase class 2
MSEEKLEIEVKFLVSDLADVRERLARAGAIQLRARTYELNERYDSAGHELLEQDKLLRLRQDEVARLTYKGEPRKAIVSEARVREELETEVGDFATMAAILKRIGFEKQQVYEKYRATYELGSVEVVLDEMPFGDFVELEGVDPAIREAADKLALNWDERILENYLFLMARLKSHHNLPFDDLTFANFATLDVSVADLFAR